MKLVQLVFVVMISGIVSSYANATPVGGEAARAIRDLIAPTNLKVGLLFISGGYTERADPPIEYFRVSFGPNPNSQISLTPEQNSLVRIVAVLESVGIAPSIFRGGSTYVDYVAMVDCRSSASCDVSGVSR